LDVFKKLESINKGGNSQVQINWHFEEDDEDMSEAGEDYQAIINVPFNMIMVKDMRENYGVFCSIVVYPVIPKGMIILRLIPTAMHTDEDIQITLDAFSAVREKMQSGVYKQFVPEVLVG
jgi:7-keto-8-aminopelargonate synthetase-like enzyme